ncbi:MAG: hypothetical protein KZQ74_04670 [gamma proteobacterium symbiont of Bathyaustriella thionipta]|nr:hypothetical protein [gamma proteobacterium symbiont of Bathyaustriella thionipta]
MNFRGIKIQIMLDRLHVLFWFLCTLILLPTAATQAVHSAERSSLSVTTSITHQKLSQNTYGPVRKNEGLWEIADKLRLNFLISRADFSVPQIAVALYEKNPEAFREQNINGVMIGTILIIPDRERILKLTKSEAFSLFLQHWEVWKIKDVAITEADSTELMVQDVTIDVSDEKSQRIQTQLIDNETNKSQLINKLVQPEHTVMVNNNVKSNIIEKPAELAQSRQVPAVTTNIEKIKINVRNERPEQPLVTRYLDYVPQIQFNAIYKQALQGIIDATNWVNYHFNSSFFNDNIPKPLTHSLMAIGVSVVLLFTFLIWLFKREETDFIKINPSHSIIESAVFTEDKYVKVENTITNDNRLPGVKDTESDVEAVELLQKHLF